jgi:hypothetical protein
LVPAATNSAVSSAVSVISARDGQLNPALASRFNVNRTVDRRNTYSPGNLVEPDPGGRQTKHFAHLALISTVRLPRR